MSERIPYLNSRKNSAGKVYYRYKMPDGTWFDLGSEQEKAERQARYFNHRREERVAGHRGKLLTVGRKLRSVLDEFEPIKLRSSNSVATQREWSRKIQRYREWVGDWDIAKVTVRELDALLVEKAPSYDPYRLHRLLLGEVFTYALGKGYRSQAEGNPAQALLPPKLARQRLSRQRQRLSMKMFEILYSLAEDRPWMQDILSIGLMTGLRRVDLCNLKASDFTPSTGNSPAIIRVIPSKTDDRDEAGIGDPVALEMVLSPEAEERIKIARRRAPLSPFIIHKTWDWRGQVSTDREHPTQILPDQMSRTFMRLVREARTIHPKLFSKSNPPSLHELRSLSARLYEETGEDPLHTQIRLGHADPNTTAIYLETHEVEYVPVKVGLPGEVMAVIG